MPSWSAGRPVRPRRCLTSPWPPPTSALQRARGTLRQQLPAAPGEWRTSDLTDRERELLEAFIWTHESGDTDAAVARANRHPAAASYLLKPGDRLEALQARRAGF